MKQIKKTKQIKNTKQISPLWDIMRSCFLNFCCQQFSNDKFFQNIGVLTLGQTATKACKIKNDKDYFKVDEWING